MGCGFGKNRLKLPRGNLSRYDPPYTRVPGDDPSKAAASSASSSSSAKPPPPTAAAAAGLSLEEGGPDGRARAVAPPAAAQEPGPGKASLLTDPEKAVEQLGSNLLEAGNEVAQKLGLAAGTLAAGAGSALKASPFASPRPEKVQFSAREQVMVMGEQEAGGPAATKPAMGRSSDTKRALDYLASLKDLPADGPVCQGVALFLQYGLTPLMYVAWAYVWVAQQLYGVYKLLPMNVVDMLFGLALCLFGGVYFAAIAAVEAARVFGGADLWEHLQTCWEEGSRIYAASQLDDQADKDRDGVRDVAAMSRTELVQHKAKVALMAVQDPDRLQKAAVALINVYLAVIATLKFEFAKTVAVALGIASMLTLPATRLLGPFLAMVMGEDLNHWIPCIIDTSVKLIAVIAASFLQAVISAFYSGLRGGRMFASGLFNIASERGWMEQLPDSLVSKPFDPNQSYLDEVIAYPLAALGFYLQITNGFALVFPFNVILFPLSIVEFFLRWQVYT